MNYTVQKRIKEIIELLDHIINDLERTVRKFDLERPNAEHRRETYRRVIKFFDSKMEWENIVLEKTIQLKDSIQNEYHAELEELKIKEAQIHKGLDALNPKFDEIRAYFYDEHFLLNFFQSYPKLLLEFGQIIIVAEGINWKPTFLKLANILIKSSNCDIEAFENFIKHMNDSKCTERETVMFLFSPENVDKNDLEQKMESNYERFSIIDKLMNNTTIINQILESENDMELVLSSLINSDEGYQNLSEPLKYNELVYLFAAFNSSHSFMYSLDNIRSNEAIVNFAFNAKSLRENKTLTPKERVNVKKQNAKIIYPYASEEIKANEYIDDLANNESGGNDKNGGINLSDFAIK